MPRTIRDLRQRVVTDDGVEWHAPGAGTWVSAADHMPYALSAEYQRIYLPNRSRAMRDMFARYGVPADSYDGAYVNDREYDRLRPLVGADSNAPPPPMAILKLATRLHPEFRRRTRTMAETLQTKRWRIDHDRWWNTLRPSQEARCLAFAAVDRDALDTAGAIAHLGSVAAFAEQSIYHHFDLKGLDSFPVGDLLALTRSHGVPSREVIDAFAGLSPASRPPAELVAVADAVRATGSRPTSFEEVRAASPDAAAALDAHLLHHGHRLLSGYDVAGPTAIEQPAIVIAAITALVDNPPATSQLDGIGDLDAVRVAAIRERLPATARHDFDERLHEATLGYPVRDDNGPFTFQWPVGLLRHAMLTAGRVLAADGVLPAADLAIDLTTPELIAVMRGDANPDGLASLAAERHARRLANTARTPPPELGPPEAPAPVAALPAALARAVDAVDAFLESMIGNTRRSTDRTPLVGDGIGAEPFVGRAVVATCAEDALMRIEPGDVLVTTSTTPAFNAAIFIAGAVVTEEGGLLSHAALVARETGIPTVVGAGSATALIADGDEVEVDPATGRVTVRRPAAAQVG